MPTDAAFDRRRPALSRIAMVVALHALVLFVFMSSDRIVRSRPPQTVMLLTLVPPEIVKPPPPPPPPRPRRHERKLRPPAREAAAPPLHDIEVVPRTEVVPTIVDNAMPVEVAGGKPDSTGTTGAGDVGAGIGGGGASVRVRAVLDPANCERPRLPWSAEQRKLTGHVILAVLINVDGKVTDARVARSSGQPMLDETALKSAHRCHFVAATVDKVPVPSWELFRFSWMND
jgi:protein TonB